ncbi:class I SAM-dependent methyltransferase [Candidatus Woesearchaeota archaeon]|nr:class I SAM-dependent methyltransferase [Candidatus Woesearchaeota archaeon]
MRKNLLHRLFHLASAFPVIRRFVWKAWYKYVAKLDNDGQIIFMNYGFVGSAPARLKKSDLRDRFCIQFYHHIAGAISLNGKDVLEIGSGRGGGSSYIMRYLSPKSMTGVDFSREAVDFCKNHYSANGPSFHFGDAESLPFEDCKFDVVINVESSHCYGDMAAFLKESFRVLRPNGYFLFADFRYREDIDDLRSQLVKCGFEFVKEEDITGNVLKSMEMDSKRKLRLIEKKVPRLLQNTFQSFAGTKGSPIFESFRDGSRVYFNFILKKRQLKN